MFDFTKSWKELSGNESTSGAQASFYKNFFKQYKLDKYISSCKIILITGTNGKGTVAKLLYRYLIRYVSSNVGLFISPHLLSINERIQARGRIIETSQLQACFQQFSQFIKKEQLIFFTTLFFLALLWFKQQRVTYLVIECGIGAREDVTINLPNHVGVVTSIAHDHEKLLGSSLEAITKNKIAVLKRNGSIYITEGRVNLLAIINQYARSNDGIVINSYCGKCLKGMHTNESCSRDYEYNNCQLATKIITNEFVRRTSYAIVYQQMSELQLPIKSYYLAKQSVAFFFFTAHNPNAVRCTLSLYVKKLKITKIIFGCLKNKNYPKMLQIVGATKIKLMILVTNHPHSITKNDLSSIFHSRLKTTTQIKELTNENVLVLGSHHVVAMIINMLKAANI